MESLIIIDRDALRTLNIKYLTNLLKYSGEIFNEDIFETISTFLPTKFKERIIEEMFQFAKKLKIDMTLASELYTEGTNDRDETIKDILERKPIQRKFQKQIIKQLIELNNADNGWKKSSFNKRIIEVQRLFGLSELDCEIITLTHVVATNDIAENIVDQLNEYEGKRRSNRYHNNLDAHIISILLGQNSTKVKQRLLRESTLKKAGILDTDNEMNDEIQFFIEGESETPLLQKFYTEFNGKSIGIEDLHVNDRDLEMLKILYQNRQPKSGVNILLYGKPGTGKTEFARAFGKLMGEKTFEISNETNDDNYRRKKSDNRAVALSACQAKIENCNSTIIIDEADSMLNTQLLSFFSQPDAEKGAVNNLLDKTTTFNIWIANYIHGMDESSLRRFDYAIKFESFSFSQRRSIWKNLINKYVLGKYCSKNDIDYLAEKYQVNAAGISMALNHAKRTLNTKGAKNHFLNIVENLLTSHSKIITGKEIADTNKDSYAPKYSLDGLNIKGKADSVIQVLERFDKSLEHPESNIPLRNVNLLLYGAPGTGKTEFAKYNIVAKKKN